MMETTNIPVNKKNDAAAMRPGTNLPLSPASDGAVVKLHGVVFEPIRVDRHFLSPYRVQETGHAEIVHVSTDDISKTPNIRHALIEQISNATQKILFCSFLFADEEIVRALCAAAERLHGGVYILTALGKHLRAEVLELDADMDANAIKHQERAKRHDDHLRRLAHAGAWVRSAEDCHAKFCVVDDTGVIVTSANATQEAYEANPEDGLVFLNASIAREFGRLFAHIWQHLTTLESTPGSHLNVHSLQPSRTPLWRSLSATGSVNPVATLRRSDASLQSAAIAVIDRAQDHLAIATYSFLEMENHPVGEALARALGRGVRIDVLVQPRNHIEAQRAALAWLVALAPDRVRLHGHRRTHTKSVVADQRTVLLWTGNLDGRHGWADGIEVGVVVEDAGVASAVANWTADVMRRATFAAQPLPGEPTTDSEVLASPSTHQPMSLDDGKKGIDDGQAD